MQLTAKGKLKTQILLQDGSVELATSSDEEDAANPFEHSAAIDGHDIAARPAALRKRDRVDEPNDDPDQATSVRVRHNDHQHSAAPAAAAAAPAITPPAAESSRPASEAAAATHSVEPQRRPATHVVHPAHRLPRSLHVNAAAGQAASNGSAKQGRAASSAPRPMASSGAASGNATAVSASSQQGDCIAPDGTFVGRAAAAGLPPNIMRQTKAALGLWEQLHETASTPSTVLAPVNRHGPAVRTVSVGTDNSAA